VLLPRRRARIEWNFEEEETGFEPAISEMMLRFKSEQEGGLATYGLPGGQCRTPENNDDFFGYIGREGQSLHDETGVMFGVN
jgi:hypothetical protein